MTTWILIAVLVNIQNGEIVDKFAQVYYHKESQAMCTRHKNELYDEFGGNKRYAVLSGCFQVRK